VLDFVEYDGPGKPAHEPSGILSRESSLVRRLKRDVLVVREGVLGEGGLSRLPRPGQGYNRVIGCIPLQVRAEQALEHVYKLRLNRQLVKR
jgi:hypothetical protein